MNSEAIESKTQFKEKYFTFHLLLTVVAAFLAALVFRRSAGIIAMTPAVYVICFAAAFIELKFSLKATIFVLSVFSINSIEQSDMLVSALYSALCLLACCVFEYSVRRMKRNKKQGIIFSSASGIVCIVLSLIFVGNPITAFVANEKMQDHIDSTYPKSKSEFLGAFEFSDIYYDFSTKAYTIDASATKFPTEGGTITTNKNHITDRFFSRMEEKLAEPSVLEIKAFLRTCFPNDNFDVKQDRIVAISSSDVLNIESQGLRSHIVYEITLGGVQSFDAMQEKVRNYMNFIEGANIEYAQIVFKSGKGEWYRRTITIDKGSFSKSYLETNLILKGASNRFDGILKSQILDKQYLDYVNQHLCIRSGICYKHQDVHCFCLD